jgi:hypothetical protein
MDLLLYANSLEDSSITHDQWRVYPYAHIAITNIVRIYVYFMRVRIVAKTASSYLSHCLSVCLSACISAATTGWMFVKFDIGDFLKSVKKLQICQNMTQISGTLHEGPTVFHIFASDICSTKI